MKVVAPENVFGAFAIGQVTLLLLLIPRFWQRGIAVSYWQQRMLAPLAPTPVVGSSPIPFSSAPAPAADTLPEGAPAIDPLQS
jgi:hypothetical protein